MTLRKRRASTVVPALAAVLLIFFSSNHQSKTAASPRTRTVPAADFATTVAAALYVLNWPNIIRVNYMWDSLSVNNFVYRQNFLIVCGPASPRSRSFSHFCGPASVYPGHGTSHQHLPELQ